MSDNPHLTLTAVMTDWGKAHGGRSLVGEVAIDDQLVLSLKSWDITGNHTRLRAFTGKRVRVTIVVDEEATMEDTP